MQRLDYSSNVHVNSCIRFALLNARSVNNKAATINDLITYNEIDIMIIAETWHAFSMIFSCADQLPRTTQSLMHLDLTETILLTPFTVGWQSFTVQTLRRAA